MDGGMELGGSGLMWEESSRELDKVQHSLTCWVFFPFPPRVTVDTLVVGNKGHLSACAEEKR